MAFQNNLKHTSYYHDIMPLLKLTGTNIVLSNSNRLILTVASYKKPDVIDLFTL